MPTPTVKSAVPVKDNVYIAITHLDAALKAAYGCDFSYTICGHGTILAANNIRHVVVPRTIEGD